MWVSLVETKNRALEETAAIFDGEDALEKIIHEETAQRTPITHEIANEKA